MVGAGVGQGPGLHSFSSSTHREGETEEPVGSGSLRSPGNSMGPNHPAPC